MSLVTTVEPGTKVRLSEHDPRETHGATHESAAEQLATLNAELTALQELHYAASTNGVLIVLQGLDTAGKDGTIKHVMAQVNPTSCRVESFKVPTVEELSHDFLWRAHRVTPPQGYLSIFNRSYYEDVLVVRVHDLVPQEVWSRRYEHINNFEALLHDAGTIMLKFFLHISKDEQTARLRAREDDPSKAWKLSSSDWTEHELYDAYITAYEDALSRCSTAHAPWHIVPADHKWYRDLAVAHTIVETLKPHAAAWRAELTQRGRENLARIREQRRAP